MLRLELWKRIVISVVLVFGILLAIPNFIPQKTLDGFVKATGGLFPSQKISLGLDLQGGSHLLLQVITAPVIQERLETLTGDIRAKLTQENITIKSLQRLGNAIQIILDKPEDSDKVIKSVRALDSGLTTNVTDGTTIAAQYSETELAAIQKRLLEQSIEIVRKRVDETGTKEPVIQQQGTDRILLQLPGIDDPDRIKDLLGKTAKLSFHLLDSSLTPEDIEARKLKPGVMYIDGEGGVVYPVNRLVQVSGDRLLDAFPSFDQNNSPVVQLRFDALGATRFADTTSANVFKRLAIVLDGVVISAPEIQAPILNGNPIITGGFDVQEAQDLSLLLRSGALPAPLEVLEERTVGPSLGADSIESGKIAGVVSMILVIGLMLAFYGFFGSFAAVSLCSTLVLIFAALSLFQATLTLPGIAGIVLTIGMAVDANVLIFERIKEEIRLGRSPISAMDTGFQEAMSSIYDSNLTTVIAGVVLYTFGTGPVRGFAVTLIIGIVASVFSAVMVTRWIMAAWLNKTRPKTLNMIGVLAHMLGSKADYVLPKTK